MKKVKASIVDSKDNLINESDLTMNLSFDYFYNSYPKKENKKKSKSLWDKLSDKKKMLAIVDVPRRLETHSQWSDKQFIPAPNVYLNGEKWNDEIVVKKTLEDKIDEAGDGTDFDKFWKALIQMYGGKFSNSFGLTMPSLWRIGLKGLTKKEIARIINYLMNDKDERMADLPKIKRIRSIGVFQGTFLELPKPKVNKTKVKSEVEKMKSILSNHIGAANKKVKA